MVEETVQELASALATDAAPQVVDVPVVCASGNRSRVACALLDARGFRTRDVDGGTTAWLRAGHTVEVSR